LILEWKRLFTGFDRTQHLITSHLVRIQDEEAVALSQVQATQYLDSEEVEGEKFILIAGHYEHKLEKQGELWKVTVMRFNYGFHLGNPKLLEVAAKRAAELLENDEEESED
jgi:hypothetical protein